MRKYFGLIIMVKGRKEYDIWETNGQLMPWFLHLFFTTLWVHTNLELILNIYNFNDNNRPTQDLGRFSITAFVWIFAVEIQKTNCHYMKSWSHGGISWNTQPTNKNK
jgi:hypothetical protein